MIDSSNKNTISFIGEVVGTLKEGDRQILKIVIKSGNVDLLVTNCEDLHLGDALSIEAEIKVKNIKLSENSFRNKLS